MRKKGHVAQSMQCKLEYQVVEAGRSMKLGEYLKLSHCHRTWVDEINDLLWERDLHLKGKENEKNSNI